MYLDNIFKNPEPKEPLFEIMALGWEHILVRAPYSKKYSILIQANSRQAKLFDRFQLELEYELHINNKIYLSSVYFGTLEYPKSLATSTVIDTIIT